MTEKCSARVLEGHGFHRFQCSRNAKVERDGMWYCGTHDPVKVKERRAKSAAKADAEWEAKKARWAENALREKRAQACLLAFEGRPLDTEKIEPGVFWELVQAARLLNACPPDYVTGKWVHDLLAKLGVE